MQKDDIANSLGEFGLSRYEVKAYIALLSRGPLSVSELAYHASIPRTKAYGTLNRLAKKGLAVITYEKPVIYGAAPPRQAFNELLAEQDRRIRGMRSMVDWLHQMGSEAKRPKGAEEHTYLVLEPDLVLSVVREMISTARSAVVSSLDSWGARLLLECGDSVKRAVAKNVDIKLLVCEECAADLVSSLPKGVDVRRGREGMNLFVFDRSSIVMVNGSDGRGVLFRSADLLASMYNRLFYSVWGDGKAEKAPGESAAKQVHKESRLVRVVSRERAAVPAS